MTQFQTAHGRLQFRALLLAAPVVAVWVAGLWLLVWGEIPVVPVAVSAVVYLAGVLAVAGGRRRRDRFGVFLSAHQICVIGPFTDLRRRRAGLAGEVELETISRASMEKLAIGLADGRHVAGQLVHVTRRSPWAGVLYRTPNILYRRTVDEIDDPSGPWEAVADVQWHDDDASPVLRVLHETLACTADLQVRR